MDLWAYHNQVKIDFSRPGKPADNAYVESFNGTLRAECLDARWFGDVEEARQRISDNSRMSSCGFRRMTGTGWVGASCRGDCSLPP